MAELPSVLREQFEALMALSPEARAEALAGIADETVRNRLARMISSTTDTGGVFPDAAALAESLWRQQSAELAPGSTHAGWQVISRIGSGGSSSVYKVQRRVADDGAPGAIQVAALKLLNHRLTEPGARLQFDRERRALLALQHPDIARLIDGGVTADGQGFLILEWVDGVPLTEHARTQRLDLRERVALMVRVARAVDAAHRSLVVHRDLKPGNVLVGRDGDVKLLDFGIAKLLADDAPVTETRVRAYTPAYAAPEQRSGGPTTTATDVYALGVLLGELLTGRRLGGDDDPTPSQRIDENTPEGTLPAPPITLRRLLRGDLDNILRKALARLPEARYPSAAAFAEDLNNVLEGRPVTAHPPSRWYRFGKLVRRNRAATAAIALLTLGLIASTAVALGQARAAKAEAARAEYQAELAAITKNFALEIFSRSSPRTESSDRKLSIPEMVAAAAEDVGKRFAEQPRVQLELYAALGRVLRQIGDVSASVAVLEKGEVISASFDPGDPLRVAVDFELMRSLNAAGRAREALDRLERLLALPDSAYPPEQFHRGTLRKIEMVALARALEPDAALAAGRELVAIADARCAADLRECETLGETLNDVGAVSLGAGRLDEGIALLRRAVATKEAAGRPAYSIATSRYFLGAGLAYLGEYPEALSLMRDAAAIAVAAQPRLSQPALAEWDLLALQSELRVPPDSATAASLFERAKLQTATCANLRLVTKYRYAVAIQQLRGIVGAPAPPDASGLDCEEPALIAHRIALGWQLLADGDMKAAAELSDALSGVDFGSLRTLRTTRAALRSAALELSFAVEAPRAEIARFGDHAATLEALGVSRNSVDWLRAAVAAQCVAGRSGGDAVSGALELPRFAAWPIHAELSAIVERYCA